MKLFALYPNIKLPNLEFNHRKYCEKHGISYNKIVLDFSQAYESQKLAKICEILQNNVGETCFFIDNYTYFQNFDIFPNIDRDIILQKYSGGNLELSFFIVKSNASTIKTFFDFRKHLTIAQIEKKHVSNNRDYVPESILNSNEVQNFPIITKKNNEVNYYFNGNIILQDLFKVSNILSINVKSITEEKNIPLNGLYCAEYFCLAQKNKKTYPISTEKFEVFNEGHENALVTLYTKEVEEFGVISEANFKRYCKDHGITLYVYRDIPTIVDTKKISGAWCKPFLLLNHFEDHKAIGWLDSDIIIGKNYKIKFRDDISVYQDVGNWWFNSGVMVFKNSKKNKKLLEEVLEEVKKENKDVSSTYVGGGDQAVFIDYFLKHYPDKVAQSYFSGNTHPFFPYSIKPTERQNFLTHFMGFQFHVRSMLMKAFDSECT